MSKLDKMLTGFWMAALAWLAFALSGCSTTEPREVTVYRDVPVPVHTPCPSPAQKPVPPRRVAQDSPAMPKLADGSTDWQAVSRILGAKVIEWIGYGDKADTIMTECSKPGGAIRGG